MWQASPAWQVRPVLCLPHLRRRASDLFAFAPSLASSFVSRLMLCLSGMGLVICTACGGLAPADSSLDDGLSPLKAPGIRSVELWYATAPAAGVWAELRVVVDNPLPADTVGTGATAGAANTASDANTILLVSGVLLDEFTILATEPALLALPQRRPDGWYALVFPPAISRSLNWNRLYLETRGAASRAARLDLALEGAATPPASRSVTARVLYVDRQADPFRVVPEPLVRWVPGRARTAFPVLVFCAFLVGATAATGCAMALYMVRR